MSNAAVTSPGLASRPRLLALRDWVAAQRHWRALALAFLAGLISAAAFAPLYLVPLLIPCFLVLFWQVTEAPSGKAAFWRGWAFGAGHFLGGLYWVGIAMTVDFERFWWFLPISVGSLAAGLALFVGLSAWLTWRLRRRIPRIAGALPSSLLFTLFWLIFVEWTRSWLLSGFPWNLLGTVWAFEPAALQLASVTGVWGLSCLTLLAAVSPAWLADEARSAPGRWVAFGSLWLLLLLVFAGGHWRMASPPTGGQAERPTVRLVQPSVPQALKWAPEEASNTLRKLISLSRAPGFAEIDLVVWPETAVPYNLWRAPEVLSAVATAAPPDGLLVTGAPRYSIGGPAYNSLHAVTPDGRIAATYDKVHLVPFGEYVPFADLLGDLNITVTRGSFDTGPGLSYLDLPGFPDASPLICYEVIFPAAVVPSGPRPEFILNITNDAWFGVSSGPYQHLATAQLRAVEEGMPLIRAANNGVSAIIDAYGQRTKSLDLNEIGVLDGSLPRPSARPTVFSALGNTIVALLAVVLLLGIACTSMRKPQH